MPPEFTIRLDPHQPGPGPARGVAHVSIEGGLTLVVLMLERGHKVEAVTPTVRTGLASYRSYDVPYWNEMRTAVEAAWNDATNGNGAAA